MAVTFDNATFGGGQSALGATALGSFTGTALTGEAVPITIDGSIDVPGNTVTVDINAAGIAAVDAQGTYLGYSGVPGGTDYVYYFAVTGGGLITPVTVAVTGAPSLPDLSVATPVVSANVTAPVGPATPCYVTGTHIRTPDGDVAVERLEVGQLVLTASGEVRPIKWIGHRRTDCASHINPVAVLPIRIAQGALAPDLPQRDLVVSPGHRLHFDDVLIPAERLVNGTTISREQVAETTYWHVELDSHALLIAEGIEAESYLPAGNRRAFDNSGDVVEIHPDFSATMEEEGLCAPLVIEGPRLTAVKKWLMARAEHLGARTIADPGLKLLADGEPLTPVEVRQGRFRFVAPEGTAELRIVSRSAAPAEVDPASTDTRKLGVLVRNLRLDHADLPLESLAGFDGWHGPETAGRWTRGEATLPIARIIDITIETLPAYNALPAPETKLVRHLELKKVA